MTEMSVFIMSASAISWFMICKKKEKRDRDRTEKVAVDHAHS